MSRLFTKSDVSEIVRRRVNQLNDKISHLQTTITMLELEKEMKDGNDTDNLVEQETETDEQTDEDEIKDE